VLQVIRLIVEQHGDERKSRDRGRAEMREVGDSIQLCFDGNRDLLFDFFRRASWPLRDDPYVFVGNVGIRFNRKVVERDDAPDQQPDTYSKHERAVAQGEIDQKPNHAYCSSVAEESCRAFVATLSCGFSPLATCTNPSLVWGPSCNATRRN